MLEDYFSVRGWGSNAMPSREKLSELGIEL
jgi:aldehyde:ferredoxin oxidoreductase